MHSINDVEPGNYWLQVQILRYDYYKRPNETLLLPASCVSNAGNDGAYGAPPGTLYSEPVELEIGNNDS